MYYDVVIVGAGPGGAIAAKTLDNSNLSVCLIDTKPKEKIGKKVCGDAVGKGFFNFLHAKIGLEYPNEEVKDRINGIKVFSPDRKTAFKVETKEGGYMLDRLKFGQHLLRQIKNINLIDNTKFLDFYEKGIVVEKKKNGCSEIEKIECRIVIDASGYNAVVRKKINNNAFIEKDVDKKEIAICYREIRKYEFEDPHHCHIYLSNKFSPGGYVWEFPEGDELNVGVGVLYPSAPKEHYDAYVKFRGENFLSSKILHKGGGITPTRRPINSLVGMHNEIGIMLVGDAACQANPIHGGGIGQAMRAGFIAGIVIKKIYEKKKTPFNKISLDDLWAYNVDYMQNYGKNMASLELVRIFLQTLSDEQVNFGMRSGLIHEKDLIKISEGEEINLSAVEKLMRLGKVIVSLGTAKKLAYTAKKMKEIKKIYKNYPTSTDGFEAWKKNVKKIFDDFKKNIKP